MKKDSQRISKKSTVRLLGDLKKRFEAFGWATGDFGSLSGPCCLIGGVRAVCGALDLDEVQTKTANNRAAVRLVSALYSALEPTEQKTIPAFDNYKRSKADVLIGYNDDYNRQKHEIFSLIDKAIANEQRA